MKLDITFKDIYTQIRKYFRIWLIVSAVAGLVVVLIHLIILPERGRASAVLNYNYDGIEAGMAPNRTRFQSSDIKSTEVIEAAAASLEMELTSDQIASIQNNITVSGIMLDDMITLLTTPSSIYGKDDVSAFSEQKIEAFYPTQYVVQFDYREAGLSNKQGKDLFEALLSQYEEYFYSNYGNNTSVWRAITSYGTDDTADYDNQVESMDFQLEMLYNYTAAMAANDTTGFRSSISGFSFTDIGAAIESIREQNISQISSYIASNGVTKSWKDQIDEYNYRIEETERENDALKERIETYNQLIDSYEKTNAVVVGGSNQTTTEESTTSNIYQVSLQSEVYDGLVKDRIALQTQLSENTQKIGMYQARASIIQSNSSEEDVAYVEEQIAQVRNRIREIITSCRSLTSEFNRKVSMKNAVVVSGLRLNGLTVGRLLRASLADGVSVEALIFGFTLLYICCNLIWPGRRRIALKWGKDNKYDKG